MKISVRDKYYMLRRKKRIKLKDVASYVGVSIAMISLYERSEKNMLPENEKKYKEYIRNL